MNLTGRLIVIGSGLIGGSVAAAARNSGFSSHIVGVDTNRAVLEKGLSLGLFDTTGMPADPGVDDLILIAVPVLAVPDALQSLMQDGGSFAGGAVVTDVTSVKVSVLQAARHLPGGLPGKFVPGHPIAGSERSGIEAVQPALFRDRRVVLTPDATTDAGALHRVRALWQTTGAEVVEMPASEHDRILAMTSHLPHLLAFALLQALGKAADYSQLLPLSAGGFRDVTRIANSDPDLWAEIFSENARHLIDITEVFEEELKGFLASLEAGDLSALRDFLTRARAHLPPSAPPR